MAIERTDKRVDAYEKVYKYVKSDQNNLFPHLNPEDTIIKYLEVNGMREESGFTLFDGKAFCRICHQKTDDLHKVTYTRELYIHIMPADAELPKGLAKMLEEKGFTEKKEKVKQIHPNKS